jgi:hypothetical protein
VDPHLSDTAALTPDSCLALADRLLNQMIEQQEGKVLRLARRTAICRSRAIAL